jgi:hypothetical protein
MPHVSEAPDSLDAYPALSPACNERHVLPPRGLPASRRERSRFLALLRCLITPAPRLRTRRQEHGVLSALRVETSLDMLAREYPDIHLWVMAVLG